MSLIFYCKTWNFFLSGQVMQKVNQLVKTFIYLFLSYSNNFANVDLSHVYLPIKYNVHKKNIVQNPYHLNFDNFQIDDEMKN